MRVFHIIAGGRYGGAETFFTDLADALARRAIDQHVFTRSYPDRLARLKGVGCTISEARMGGPFDFISKPKLTRALYRNKPDVVLAWMNRAAKLVQPGSWINVGRIGGYYNLKYYQHCDFLICNTPDLVKHCTNHTWPVDRVEYIPNFSPAIEVEPVTRESLTTPADAAVILVLARLEESKGIDVALKSFASLPTAYLWIAGNGSRMAFLRSLAASLGVAERVRFLGWRLDREALLKSADVCLVPSRHEPFGNVIVNAWTNGTPIIAAASDGPKFLIEEGVNGLLVPVDDPQGMASAVQRVLESRDFAHRLIVGGEAQAAGAFSENTVANAYSALFERLREDAKRTD